MLLNQLQAELTRVRKENKDRKEWLLDLAITSRTPVLIAFSGPNSHRDDDSEKDIMRRFLFEKHGDAYKDIVSMGDLNDFVLEKKRLCFRYEEILLSENDY